MKAWCRSVLLAGSVAVPVFAVEAPLPEYYGLYAVGDGELYSLDTDDAKLAARRQPLSVSRRLADFETGGSVLQAPQLPDSVNFIIYIKGNALQAAAELQLRRLSFIRVMTVNEDSEASRKRYHVNSWVAAAQFPYRGVGEDAVELRYKPVKGQDEMVVAVPSSPLAPGLYRLGEDFLFSVPPLDAAESLRCVDASGVMGMVSLRWTLRPCSDAIAPSEPASSLPSHSESIPGPGTPSRQAVGFIVRQPDSPVFAKHDSQAPMTSLPAGTAAANAKGRVLGLPAPKEFALEERSGRTHIVYLSNSKMKVGWIDSEALSRFEYDCSCAARCDPLNLTLTRGSSWNECFERARGSASVDTEQ